jgi:single-strand DNA-binding protein
MSNLNKVLLMGRLTRDPELRYTPQGIPVAEIGLAINREIPLQNGERRKETTFVDVTVWRRQAEVICQWLKKGAPIFIEGSLRLDTWEGPDGQRRSKLKVVADNFQFVGTRAEREDGGGGARGAPYGRPGEHRAAAPSTPPGGAATGEVPPAYPEYEESLAQAPPPEPSWEPRRAGDGGFEQVDESEIPF